MNKNNIKNITWGIVLISIGILFFIPNVSLFPVIFLIAAVATIPNMLRKGRFVKYFTCFLWFVGLYLMFYFNIFLPILLIILGIEVFISIFKKRGERDKDRG